ncbi:MAG: hypothetical protein AAF849_04390 [Bacteroidota bacterium]
MKTSTYKAISCDFYDILEASATLKKECIINFFNANGEEQQLVSRIINLFTKDKEEFMELEHRELIRLDRIISVDGVLLPTAC